MFIDEKRSLGFHENNMGVRAAIYAAVFPTDSFSWVGAEKKLCI